MDNLVKILFELIKIDMHQIQTYREVIINISILSIAASFTISAFLYSKDCEPSIISKKKILINTHIAILIIILIIAYIYTNALDSSRAAQEMREAALERYINNKTIDFASLYPVTAGHENKLSLFMEKLPIYLAIVIVTIKTTVEYILISYNKCSNGTITKVTK